MAPKKEPKKPSEEHDEALKALRKEHGDIVYFTKGALLFAFRAPTQDEYENTHERIRKGDPLGVVNRELCQLTQVSGTLEQLTQVFEKAPRIPMVVGDELAELAEGGIEVSVKKD